MSRVTKYAPLFAAKSRLSNSQTLTRRQRHVPTRSLTHPRLGRYSRLFLIHDETLSQFLYCRTFYVDPSASDTVSSKRHDDDSRSSESISSHRKLAADPSSSDSVSRQCHSVRPSPSHSVSSQCHHVDLCPSMSSQISFTICSSRRSTMCSPVRSQWRSWDISRITSTRTFMTCGAVIFDKKLHTTLLQALKWNDLHYLPDLCLLLRFLKRWWTDNINDLFHNSL